MSFTTGRLDNAKPYNYAYADAAARTAATGFVAGDVGKVAIQIDNATLWTLTDDSPATWVQVPGPHTHAATDIASGTLATARLGSGTADATTFLRGDQSWAAPAGGGAVATDAIWDAAGDLAVGSGANTAAKLAQGGNGTFLGVSGGTLGYYTPAGGGGGGQELGYAEITAAVSTTSSSYVDISGLSVAVTIGSRPVRVRFLATLAEHNAAGTSIRARFQIYDTTAGAVVLEAQQITVNTNGALFVMDARHAPASGSRTYKVQWKVIDAGTMNLKLMTAGQVVAYIQVEEL